MESRCRYWPVGPRFWAKVTETPTCWNWTGSKVPNGYGQLNFMGKRILSHRLMWIMAKGPIPDGLFVLHKCDTRSCVRPSHLFLGTLSDNMQDMVKKGRGSMPTAKLKPNEVIEIRALYAQGNKFYRELAEQYGVCVQTIANVVHKTKWKTI